MKRDFKLSSIVVINLLAGLIIMLVNFLLKGGQELTNLATTGEIGQTGGFVAFIADIVQALVKAAAGLVIARGLLRNRMGSVGDYLNHSNIIRVNGLLFCFILDLVIVAIPSIIGSLTSPKINQDALMAGQVNVFDSFWPAGLGGIVLLYLSLATAYKYYVVADQPEGVGVFEYLRRTFKNGHQLMGKSLLTYLKYVILPSLGFIVLIFLSGIFILDKQGPDGMGLFILVFGLLGLAMIAWTIFAMAFVEADLSRHYLRNNEGRDDFIPESEF